MGALCATGLVLLLLAPRAAAEDAPPELVTDRPDRTESAATVPPGFVQLETGALLSSETDGEADLRVFEGPGTLLRVGLTRALELRLAWAGHVNEESDARSGVGARDLNGSGDGAAGVKLRLRREDGRRPEVALLAEVSVPLGDAGLSSERYDPSVLLSVARTLDERFSLGVNLGARRETVEAAGAGRDTTTDLVYSAALGIGLTERLGAFAELFGAEPLEHAATGSGGSSVSVDAGFTWLVRPNLQLDLSGGGGLSDEAADWFVGAGLSVRWPR